MLFDFLIGILIGMLVAAPMGPVGILILRDTLHRGRKDGFLMGIGASISDTIYGIISYLGVGLVLNFIEKNDSIIRILGSILIIGFSIHLYRTPVKKVVNPNKEKKLDEQTGWHKIAGAFAVTISNPLIVFFFLALYSRFNFVYDGPNTLLHIILGMLGIAAGGLIWWTLFTWGIGKLRNHISISGIHWINRITALIFSIVGIIGLLTSVLGMI
ncbi:threonine transporter RhtB [Porphyromonas macacae]|uniref:Leucine export protein LeuE n=1 Tax=Porphyromonas macacae TaxID=28115 RepID=A0A379DGK8_9PORP|nr:LysE family transporter [Porphyromonas macacae]KGN98662.1 threonine transporter RhtB [Porphyromonas macacae]SUB77127.1 leucine export protein LeuE [Porphyromonas macacae]SUB88185.1 leucine export protein LeuE [Porphyromonas macacae]